MKTHTITRGAALVGSLAAVIASRLVAFVAGCICVACAGAILFEDVVMHGAAIQLSHVLTAGILSIALLAGHLRGEAWRERRWPAALGFFKLFVAATALVVYLSTGKQAEHTFQSQAEADIAAGERTRLRQKIDEAEFILASCPATSPKKWFGERCGLRDARTKECNTGNGSACQGKTYSVGTYEAAIKGHNADLEKLGAPKPVAPDAESFANIAAVFGYDKTKVKAGAILVVPFIRTILFELGGIWCLGFAFRPLPKRATKTATVETQAASRQPLSPAEQSDFPDMDADEARKLGIGGEPGAGNWGNGGGTSVRNPGKPDKPNNGGLTVVNGGKSGKRPSSRQEFEFDVVTRRALGQSIDRQDELAEWHGVHPGTASKWLKDMRKRGLIPASQRVGRCHRLVAAD